MCSCMAVYLCNLPHSAVFEDSNELTLSICHSTDIVLGSTVVKLTALQQQIEQAGGSLDCRLPLDLASPLNWEVCQLELKLSFKFRSSSDLLRSVCEVPSELFDDLYSGISVAPITQTSIELSDPPASKVSKSSSRLAIGVRSQSSEVTSSPAEPTSTLPFQFNLQQTNPPLVNTTTTNESLSLTLSHPLAQTPHYAPPFSKPLPSPSGLRHAIETTLNSSITGLRDLLPLLPSPPSPTTTCNTSNVDKNTNELQSNQKQKNEPYNVTQLVEQGGIGTTKLEDTEEVDSQDVLMFDVVEIQK